jgi:allantoin racemase
MGGASMKLWYQSMSRFKAKWNGYPAALRKILDQVKDPDTEIEVHGITKIGGFADQYRYLEYLETGEVMENIHTAMARGFDAFLIGNIGDPGLRECREIANIPVLGLCETSLHVACLMGANFSLVTINEKFTPRIIENVDRAGLRGRLAAVHRMKVDRILNLDAGFADPVIQKDLIDQFQAAAKANTDAGAEVVIAAGGVVMALLAHAGVYTTPSGAPILNGITTLVKMGEMAVKLDRIMGGTFTSKRLQFAPPGPDQIDEIREYYGASIYPTVLGRKPV